jgi:glycosyltransferase involved in cell wall biosynthesis
MEKLKELKTKPVYIYTQSPIRPTGSGSEIRHYTNIRAYLDLGFDVEVIQIVDLSKPRSQELADKPGMDDLNASWRAVKFSPAKTRLFQKITYKVGFPFGDILNLMFPARRVIQKEIHIREKMTPGAIHQFEYTSTASAAIGLKGIKSIWSCHDFFSDRIAKLTALRAEIGRIKDPAKKKQRIKYLERAEKLVAANCNLVLTIAKHENEEFRKRWGYKHIELFPMSWPDETPVPRIRNWLEDGKLRLFHLGRPDGFIGYSSLKFLLGEVFPLLPNDLMNKIEMMVIGKMTDTEYSRKIQEMAKLYPQVRFLGYVDDVRSFYGSTDLQVVGSTVATGLRTRIVESFVYGLPVLSTDVAAEGVLGIQHERNILLASDAQSFAFSIMGLFDSPESLGYLAEEARDTYEKNYSRSVAADKLAESLEHYL